MLFQLFDGDESYELEAGGVASLLEYEVVQECATGAVIVRNDAAVAMRKADGWHLFPPAARSGVYSFDLAKRKTAKG